MSSVDPSPTPSPGPSPDESWEKSPSSGLPAWIQDTPYWLIAVAAHVVALFIFGTIVVLEIEAERSDRKTIVQQLFEEPEYDPTLRRDIERRPEILEKLTRTPVKNPSVVKKKSTAPKVAKKVVDLAEMGLGAGPSEPPSGLHLGRLNRGGDGVTSASESAVLAALHWLRRHQHPDGRWSSHDFHTACDAQEHGATCTFSEGATHFGPDDRGFEGFDVGVTALALLAFLGHGHTHQQSDVPAFRETVRKGAEWLRAQQVESPDPQLDGLYGPPSETNDEWVYNHAIATMAMGELLLLSRDRIRLSRSVDRATRWCLRAQNPGWGWKYQYLAGESDTSVTGWMVLALKATKSCAALRLIKIRKDEFTPAFEGALAWIDAMTSSTSGLTGYQAPGDEGSRLQKAYPEAYPFSKDLSCMTAVGVLCRVFAGESKRSETIRRGVAHLRGHLPEWRPASGRRRSPINFYSWYYATYALYQIGGRPWHEWNEALQPALIENQRVGRCEDGSWDPIGEWGIAGGRVYSTAMGALTLEVYYRFIREGS